MRQAVVSDIHANKLALTAVLDDIASQQVDKIICLGDIIGYGPHPRDTLLASLSFDLSLMGNHEEAVLYGALGFNEKAKKAIDWTREELLSEGVTGEQGQVEEDRKLWDFLGGLKSFQVVDGIIYAHGSPRDPTREYVFAQDRFNHAKMDEIFAAYDEPICFVGHTHIPGVFEEDYTFIGLNGEDCRYALNGKKILVNVGSVGQPRDGDPRACYVIFDGKEIQFRRVAYDIEKTISFFNETPLPKYLSSRLREGK